MMRSYFQNWLNWLQWQVIKVCMIRLCHFTVFVFMIVAYRNSDLTYALNEPSIYLAQGLPIINRLRCRCVSLTTAVYAILWNGVVKPNPVDCSTCRTILSTFGEERDPKLTAAILNFSSWAARQKCVQPNVYDSTSRIWIITGSQIRKTPFSHRF